MRVQTVLIHWHWYTTVCTFVSCLPVSCSPRCWQPSDRLLPPQCFGWVFRHQRHRGKNMSVNKNKTHGACARMFLWRGQTVDPILIDKPVNGWSHGWGLRDLLKNDYQRLWHTMWRPWLAASCQQDIIIIIIVIIIIAMDNQRPFFNTKRELHIFHIWTLCRSEQTTWLEGHRSPTEARDPLFWLRLTCRSSQTGRQSLAVALKVCCCNNLSVLRVFLCLCSLDVMSFVKVSEISA